MIKMMNLVQLVILAVDGWYGERRSSYGQLETSNKLRKSTKLDLNPCQQNKLPGLRAVYNAISCQISRTVDKVTVAIVIGNIQIWL